MGMEIILLNQKKMELSGHKKPRFQTEDLFRAIGGRTTSLVQRLQMYTSFL